MDDGREDEKSRFSPAYFEDFKSANRGRWSDWTSGPSQQDRGHQPGLLRIWSMRMPKRTPPATCGHSDPPHPHPAMLKAFRTQLSEQKLKNLGARIQRVGGGKV